MTIGDPQKPPHAFGPAPVVAPDRGLHMAEPELVDEADSDDAEDEPEESYRPTHAREVEPDARPALRLAGPASGKHRRRLSALSGTVRSSRGRGLQGIQISVLDDSWSAVATTVTGVDGLFIVEDLPPGTYRVAAHDAIDGDFGAAWHDGSSSPRVGIIRVKEGRTRRRVDVVLSSAAAIDLDVDVRSKKAVIRIAVTDRASGRPAGGSVRVSTKQFSAKLPLTRGRTAVTLYGSADGSPRLSKKVTVDYRGTKHTQRSSATAKLR